MTGSLTKAPDPGYIDTPKCYGVTLSATPAHVIRKTTTKSYAPVNRGGCYVSVKVENPSVGPAYVYPHWRDTPNEPSTQERIAEFRR